MSIIVCLVVLCFLGTIVRVAWGAFKLIIVGVFLAAMVHSCDRANAQSVADTAPCCRSGM
jgi:hypothetical protein